MAKIRKRNFSEFKQDVNPSTFGKVMRLGQVQKLRLQKWFLYAMTVMGCLVVQDVVMSQLALFDATTDLAVCAILLITVLEGTQEGSMFVLIASVLYYFSGSAASAYCVGLLTFLGVAASMLRQMYLHRSKSSILLAAGIAVISYEIGLLIVGLMSGLTIWQRSPVFLLTGLYSALMLFPLYPIVYRIGIIGGDTWKE